jgi:glycosyltransferase involved in cell wall biosynthesis
MHLCLLTLDFFPFRSSGLAVYAEGMVRGLVERGHQVTVVASRRAADERVECTDFEGLANVVRLPIGSLDWIGFGWLAARYLRAHAGAFDAIHFADVHFAYAYRGAFTASILQSFRQRLTSHRGHPYHTSWRNYLFRLVYYNVARWLMEKPSLRRAQHLIATSQATQREFTVYGDLDERRVTLVYPGINLDRFMALPSQGVVRERLNLMMKEPILLYVGFSTPRKGVEYLAQALNLMEVPAHLVMVGKWESGYRERFLESLGGACSQTTMVGYVADQALPMYFAAADLFVSPTLLEGFGIPLVEAMAAGLPVVTTTAGSAEEVVGEGGLVVPPADAPALATALDRVLLESALYLRLQGAGQQRARYFSEKRAAQDLERVLQQVWGQ